MFWQALLWKILLTCGFRGFYAETQKKKHQTQLKKNSDSLNQLHAALFSTLYTNKAIS